jgi:hypothetical protein
MGTLSSEVLATCEPAELTSQYFWKHFNDFHVETSMVVLTVTNTSKAIHAMVINYFLSFLYQRNSGSGVEHEIMYIFFCEIGQTYFNLCFT